MDVDLEFSGIKLVFISEKLISVFNILQSILLSKSGYFFYILATICFDFLLITGVNEGKLGGFIFLILSYN